MRTLRYLRAANLFRALLLFSLIRIGRAELANLRTNHPARQVHRLGAPPLPHIAHSRDHSELRRSRKIDVGSRCRPTCFPQCIPILVGVITAFLALEIHVLVLMRHDIYIP